MKCFLYTVLVLHLATPLFAEEPAASASTADSQHDVLFLGKKRPYVLRFLLFVDDVPYRERWERLLDERFWAFDVSGDGILDGEEKGGLKRLRLLPGRSKPTAQSRSSLLQRNPLSTKMTRSDFGLYFKQMGWEPLYLGAAGADLFLPNSQGRQIRTDTTNDQAGALLLKVLDTSGDGLLSKSELDQALRTLRKHDLDRDESISRAEITAGVSQVSQPNSGSAASPVELPAEFLNLTGNWSRAVAAKILSTYRIRGGPGAAEAPQDPPRYSEALVSQCDLDKDGALHEEELMEFLRQPPADALITARMGTVEEGVTRLHIESPGEGCQSRVNADGSALLLLETVEVEVAVEAAARGTGNLQRFEQVFEQSDRDKNGYLDQNEAIGLGTLGARFAELDADGDGQLFLRELIEAVKPAAEVASRQLRLGIGESMMDMFLALDRNQDARISVREFRALPSLLVNWDQNGDGVFDIAELPRRFRARIGTRELVSAAGVSTARVIRSVESVAGAVRGKTVPPWFQSMDRNSDGDITPREFLGTAADFQRLDRDQDGMISSAEASAVSP